VRFQSLSERGNRGRFVDHWDGKDKGKKLRIPHQTPAEEKKPYTRRKGGTRKSANKRKEAESQEEDCLRKTRRGTPREGNMLWVPKEKEATIKLRGNKKDTKRKREEEVALKT